MIRINHVITALLVPIVLFAGCNKTEYTSVSEGEWKDYTGEVVHGQRVLLEEYTGVRCKNGPKADSVVNKALKEYGDRLAVVCVHAGVFSRPYEGETSLSCQEAEVLYNYFGIYGEPAAIMMRDKNELDQWDIFVPTTDIGSRVSPYVNGASKVDISLSRVPILSPIPYVLVCIEFMEDVEGSLTLTIVITEDDVKRIQESPLGHVDNYMENNVLRCSVTDVWGMDIDADGKRGTKRSRRFPVELRSVDDVSHCTMVAFISEKESRQVLNVATIKMSEWSK